MKLVLAITVRKALLLALAIVSIAPHAVYGADSITLQSEVVAEGSKISLADFLPASAAPAIRTAAKGVSFGRAPLPGSTRTLTEDEIRLRLADSHIAADQFQIPPQITVRSRDYAISSAEIAPVIRAFLEQQGWRSSAVPRASDLQLPEQMTATQPAAKLEVIGMLLSSRQPQFRMRCRERSSCGSFLVQWNLPEEQAEILRGQPAHIAAVKDVSFERRSDSAAPALVQRGRPAILVMQGDGMRITLPVVCLERGALNQTINVRDPQNHKVLQAEVVGQGRLQTSF